MATLAGFPLGCAAFLIYCLASNRRTLTGLIFSTLLIGIVLVIRISAMEVESSAQQSMPLIISEIVLVVISLVGIAIEIGRQSYAHRTIPPFLSDGSHLTCMAHITCVLQPSARSFFAASK